MFGSGCAAGVDLYGNAVLASAKFISENPQAIAAVLRALNRAMKDTIADPAAAVKFGAVGRYNFRDGIHVDSPAPDQF
jgi:ABC-type nitrate/sulfonate/bicarbonate transport system substrate-binding protein